MQKKTLFVSIIISVLLFLSLGFYLIRIPEPGVNEDASSELEEQEISKTEEAQQLHDKCMSEFVAADYKRVICLLPYFKMITFEKGAEVAITEAKDLKQKKLINDCHLPSHSVGEANIEKNDYDLGKAFSTCPLGCFEGCFHGAFEGYAQKKGSIDNLVTPGPIPEICSEIGEDRAKKLQCVHGIGHGMMKHLKTSEMLGKIDICSQITELDYRTGCITGVVMENVNTYLELTPEKLKIALPKICEPIQKSTKYSNLLWLCAQEISSGLVAYTGDDRLKSEEFCGVLSGELKTMCISGITESRKTLDKDAPVH